MPREGWYPDPRGASGVNRWWSGTQWTEQTQFAPPPPMRPPDPPPRPPLAGYGLRLGGWLIDCVILNVVIIPLLIPFGGLLHETTTQVVTNNGTYTNHSLTFGIHGVGILIHAIVALLYGMLFIGSRRGQTPGMMLLGIRCVDANDATGSIGYGRALLRAFVEYILAVAFVLPWVIDMLFPLWDERNQTIHDKAAGSIVLDRAPAPARIGV